MSKIKDIDAPIPPGFKRCSGKHSKCGGLVKSVYEFHLNGEGGRKATCKACLAVPRRPIVNITHKSCTQCGDDKPIDDYPIYTNNGRSGCRGKCKECANKEERQRWGIQQLPIYGPSIPETHKVCSGKHSRCGGLMKPIEEFQRSGERWRPECKACHKLWRETNRDAIIAREKVSRSTPESKAKDKAWRENNREKLRQQARAIYHRDIEKSRAKARAKSKSPKAREGAKRRKNTPAHRAYIRQYEREKKQNDPAFRLRKNISIHVCHMLQSNGAQKARSFLEHVPYTMEQLKEHLERQFEPWMNWNNYGAYKAKTWDDKDTATWTWQLDHIIPQSALPYTSMDDETFKTCWAFENLRPLSAKQNLFDGNRRSIAA